MVNRAAESDAAKPWWLTRVELEARRERRKKSRRRMGYIRSSGHRVRQT
jgi:hypothetical protein